METPFDLAEELSKQSGLLEIPGNLLMKGGPEDYIGAVICLRGTLYFKNAHTPEVREALCQCFDAFKRLAEPNLTWLWREEPPEGSPLTPYAEARSLREMLSHMNENYPLSFYYTSGEQPNDASDWYFDVFGQAAWEAKIGYDTSAVEFSVPLLYHEQHSLDFMRLFQYCARLLDAEHGHAGHAFNLSVTNLGENEPTEAFMAERMPGLDAGTAGLLANRPEFKQNKIKTVSWLTLLNQARLEAAGGLKSLQDQLPDSHFAFYAAGSGVVIQSGAYPYIAGDAEGAKPAPYVLLNHLLKSIRCETVGDLHGGSRHGELRLTGWAADQWLKRLDVDEQEIPAWRTRLLEQEPRLDSSNSLPERL
ncbi:type VI immunity family protein [Halomonas sp. HNIBRBA4712]|uniref:type VI immunity family protein n=1 Tax=Halomonas sp. HNIBRBA4712 TaxID=3373087 RepID=UPI00374522D5